MFNTQCLLTHKKLLAGKCPWCGQIVIDGFVESGNELNIHDLVLHENIQQILVKAKAIELLIPGLKHSHAGTRRSAVRLLGAIGQDARNALPTLRWLLLDDDRAVRNAAQEAIKKIDK